MAVHLQQLRRRFLRLPKKRRMWIVLGVLALLLLAVPALWFMLGLQDKIDLGLITDHVRELQDTRSALWWIISLYALAAVTFFPVTLLSAAVILVFTGIKGVLYSLAGSMVCAGIGYAMGRMLGRDRMERYFPGIQQLFGKAHRGGLAGVAVIRAIPVAPYSVVNVIMGVIKMPMASYLAGTVLGLLPGKVMLSVFGMSLREFAADPSLVKILQVAAFLAVWGVVIFLCHKFAQRRQEHAATAGSVAG